MQEFAIWLLHNAIWSIPLLCLLCAFALRPLGFYRWLLDRREKKLASLRPGMTEPELLGALVLSGADRDVAEWMVDWIAPFYGNRTTANSADRPLKDLFLEAEELEDMAASFFEDHGLPMPSGQSPESLPFAEDTDWTAIAVHLSRRRRALLSSEEMAS